MQAEGTDILFLQGEEGDLHQEEEENERFDETVEQLNLADEDDTIAFNLSGGQAQVRVRELRSKGLSFQIWPAARALCWYLDDIYAPTGMLKTRATYSPTSEGRKLKENMRVLELGAGTGMVGIVCAVLGGHCTITDLPHVISNLESNATLNQQAIHSSSRGGSVVVKSLRWGERSDVEAVGHSFDLVVASDVVYYDHLFEPLINTLKWLLYSPSDDGMKSASSATRTAIRKIDTNGVSISNYAKLQEGPAYRMATQKLFADVRHTKEDLFLRVSSSTTSAANLEDISLPVSDLNATAKNGSHLAEESTLIFAPPVSMSDKVPTSAPSIEEDTGPVVLLAHLRRWKKDSHFFKKTSKLFHVTMVHKHSPEANTRAGVAIYSISRKK